MSAAFELDHVGVGGRDLDALATTYQRLGFTLTPMARHRGKATANRCIMLGHGYLELIAPVDPAIPDKLLGQLDRYAGLHIIALGIEDSAATLARLRLAGFAIDGITPLERPVDEADPTGPQARFERIPLPDAPEGTIQLIKHLTREAIWQPRFTTHANAAASLEEVVLALPDPAETAARVSRLAGLPVLPPKEGFSPDAVGAIGLLVHRLARAAGGEVIGRRLPGPFTDVAFHPASPGWGLTATTRYASGVAAVARRLAPGLVEVHNRPEIARYLARRFPRVALVLHNDPQGMRGAGTPAERGDLLRRLSWVATVSDHLRQRFLQGVPGGTVAVLPNSIDVPPVLNPERERLILFAGRVVADKGADAFVEACATVLPRLPGWRAEMVGADRFSATSPATGFTDRVRARAIEAGVAMTGYLPHDAVLERMGRAAIAVVPSRWAEPFGLSALEAMAHGAALVCSRNGGLPEVAGDCALYADPDTPGAIAEAVFALATDAPRRASLATAAWHRARLFDTAVEAGHLRTLRAEALRC